MELSLEKIGGATKAITDWLFAGRIARTPFAFQIIVLCATIVVLLVPPSTFLSASSPVLREVYIALALGLTALCLLGIGSAYARRLHDIGLSGLWTLPALIGIPSILLYLGAAYSSRHFRLGNGADLTEFNDSIFYVAVLVPFIAALWRGHSGENRYGPPPPSVEHFMSSKLALWAAVGGALILIPTSVYAGLFQSGVWVGRSSVSPSMPMIDSNSQGHLLAKCWNIKGVGAGTGTGDLGGVYRDGYRESVLDFVIAEDGQIDIIPAGRTFSKAYSADGFRIMTHGLNAGSPAGELNRFMVVAIHDGGGAPNANVNYTTFSFARTEEIWPEWQMVMSTGLSLHAGGLLSDTEQARGRLMIGDCIIR
jgi:uncharacterized membrane protein YhaH (DUF805 family)